MLVAPKPIALLVAFACVTAAHAAEPVDFSRDVLPILSANCFACHGRDEGSREGNLRLDVRGDAVRERNGLAAIAPGRPAASELIARIVSKHEDERMPPADKGRALTTTEIETLRTWIAQGADYADHWAFRPLQRPAIPSVADASWSQSPVDRFVLARLEKANLSPAPRAAAETLIRRASLDLIGLPPAADEIEQFTADSARDPAAAFSQLVDRLLASPHYGERWGRHWLDVARYADSGGFETDIFFGHAWRYRDYVVRAFNADKPFDRFIKEQIAGDELFPGDAEARLATGLYTTGPVLQEAGMVSGKLEYDQNTDFVDTTGAAFLGMTFACARCHDHKYDPVSQKEYFSLQAIFAASDQVDFAADGTKLRDRAALKNTQKEFEAEQARTRAQRETDPTRRAALLRKAGDAYIEADAALKGRVDASKRYNLIARAVERYHRAVSGAQAITPADTSALLDDEDGDDNAVIALKAQLRGVAQSPNRRGERSRARRHGLVAPRHRGIAEPRPAGQRWRSPRRGCRAGGAGRGFREGRAGCSDRCHCATFISVAITAWKCHESAARLRGAAERLRPAGVSPRSWPAAARAAETLGLH
jgi:cytochrome c553